MNDIRIDETPELISSKKVHDTRVYDQSGTEIGSVHHLMLGKEDGKVHFVVVGWGGFLGLGERLEAVSWARLNYDRRLAGYRISQDQISAAA